MSALRERLLSHAPEPIRSMRRWLLWSKLPHPTKPDKWSKVPSYTNGQRRNGSLDDENDVKQLVTLDEALDAYESKNGFEGVGFAVVSGDGIVALDLDHCLDGSGRLIEGHPGNDVAIKAESAGCYMERSPSGSGLRAIFMAQNSEAFSKGGVEAWGRARFVTVTGDVYANSGGWVSAEGVREAIEPPQNRTGSAAKREDDDEGRIITQTIIDELRDALLHIPSDDRDLWQRMGHALKTIPGDKGRNLWLEWSATSDKFDAADANKTWDGLKPTRTGHAAVFAEAQRRNWQNPRLNQSNRPNQDESVISEHSIAEAFTEAYGDSLRYDHDAGKWFEWTGARWQKDAKRKAFNFARRTAVRLSNGHTPVQIGDRR